MKGITRGISTVSAVVFVFAILLSAPVSVSAQVYSQEVSRQVEEDLNLTREIIQIKRKAIVALNMGLTEYESRAFWPVYDEYWAEMKKMGDREVALITRFAKNYVYESLTNKAADEMLKEWMSVRKQTTKLQEKFAKRFKKVIPEKKVLRYFQIENKLDLIIKSELSAQIPLAR
jgi:hypothetical protein